MVHGISMNEKGCWSALPVLRKGGWRNCSAIDEKAATEDTEESIMNKAQPEKRKCNEMIDFILKRSRK
ncbi:2917_t:CDS:2 [Rhizophagus irregularis]|nr:2917_t:CDS:2 [Rhizophagus irregularis]